MRRGLLFLLVVIFHTSLYAQGNKYSRVKIWLIQNTIQELSNLPIALDHGEYKKNTWFISDFLESQIDLIKDAGFQYDVLISDVGRYYANQNFQVKSIQEASCNSNLINQYWEDITLENYRGGSMGGFLTYSEMLEQLDSMHTLFPNLISAKDTIASFTSHENRPIYIFKISSNQGVDDPQKDNILYTGLHHAREPISMQLLIYYMWFLLEQYNENPLITNIVNNLELYFVPCVNPDGYVYNQQTNPNGGGLHRKNMRQVGNNNQGVDLNRNYDFQWGTTGTSANQNSDVYCGTHPFSEPETQAIEWLLRNHEFKIALNYHSYGNSLLFPWGYTDSQQCSDHNLFLTLGEYLVDKSGNDCYQSSLLYEASGDSDDWAYGDPSKPSALAYTPEIGSNSDGFWPSANRIEPLCKENIFQNVEAARALLDLYKYKDMSSSFIENNSYSFNFELSNLAISNSNFTLNLTPLNVTLLQNNNPITFSNLNFGQTIQDVFTGVLDQSSAIPQQLYFLLEVQTNQQTYYDTIVKYYGDIELVFSEYGNTINNWTTDSWGQDDDYYSQSYSIGDSPNGDYSNSANNVLNSPIISLGNAEVAFLEFYSKWNIEPGYDYTQLRARIVGQNDWIPLCGKYTHLGNVQQDEGKPIYDGVQDTLVKEEISLNDFLGEEIELQFIQISDDFVTDLGFNFDDLELKIITSPTAIHNVTNIDLKIYPVPTKELLNIELQDSKIAKIELFNSLGSKILKKELLGNYFQLSTSNLPKGVFYIEITNQLGVKNRKKIIVW